MYYFYLTSFLVFSALCIFSLIKFLISNKEKMFFRSGAFFSLAMGAVLASVTHGGFAFSFFWIFFGAFGFFLMLLYGFLKKDPFVKNMKNFSDSRDVFYISLVSGFYLIFLVICFVVTDIIDSKWMEEVV